MAQRNIVIKSFSDVPMADVEMIFPEKKVFIKPFVLIQLVVTVVLAIITVVTTLLQVNRLYFRSACTHPSCSSSWLSLLCWPPLPLSPPVTGNTVCMSLCMHLTHVHDVKAGVYCP